MLIFVGIDDTDMKFKSTRGLKIGTGRVAREAAAKLLAEGFIVLWVTRHQLVKSEKTICTSGKNSSKAMTLSLKFDDELKKAVEIILDVVKNLSTSDSNAGVAVNCMFPPPREALKLALRIKRELVSLEEIIDVSKDHNIQLYPLCGSGIGVIGAFAASILASTGNDDRIIDMPTKGIRRIEKCMVKVRELLDLGIAEVRSVDGETLGIEEYIYVDRLRLKLESFKPILYVTMADALWRTVELE
ncbi:MAG: hypothetical protein NDF54_08750 [archaeon GB-1867-035]|nr:hypothetical protein [Candidatus Culexmicrobium profundum]